ncbi:RNA-guided pseudouridylation complex pseudouridine synthase subunit Cbf5 [Methanosalsum natronophilum]|uniref:RNA-guided pseudouridylation complex pseudouridine synthase subunit Cbf5 n=1 Tax=Methanosalsum natronophilum TaxID=768733 RepID=UPI002169814C|nr:RNA-guided pseudouridylation complex pseudouridine synthase subunit Cbf5 [Methanosalsum natronophilum]MCS3924767.1 H/ACA ribonucleoprotein complex subunit 4 [Methanosalsum natronophilum]
MDKKNKSGSLVPESTQLVKSNTVTNDSYGTYPHNRPINDHVNLGVINLLKPKGPTSHEVTAWIKQILDIKKAGHSGSLDPSVDGLLPIMLGKATKAIRALRLSGKGYICLMRLHGPVKKMKILSVINEFQGQIFQIPPKVSAVKRSVRIRTIYCIEVLEIKENYVLMNIFCEAGTYIRKLCYDMGEALGCGANMQELRRIRTGPFDEMNAVTLQDVVDAFILWQKKGIEDELRSVVLPMEEGLSHLPSIIIRDTAVDAICRGASLAVPGVSKLDPNIKKGDTICIFTIKGEAVALSTAKMESNEIIDFETGIVAITERVIMDAGTYPSSWNKKL